MLSLLNNLGALHRGAQNRSALHRGAHNTHVAYFSALTHACEHGTKPTCTLRQPS